LAKIIELQKLFPFKRGKVRDIYDLGDKLLIVASDRISAFDYILPNLIPDKGKILTQISKFWFNQTKNIIANHFLTDDVAEFPQAFHPYKKELNLRSMLVKKADRIPFECIVRGYIVGSVWKDYQKSGKICEITLPPNLQESEKLPEPVFTPSTKAETGHDENIGFSEMQNTIGKNLANKIKDVSIKIYNFAHNSLLEKGMILADTKFEFGLINNNLILIDELITPDSSRLWDANTYQKRSSPKSYDKQFVRDYLLDKGIKKLNNITQNSEILQLPEDIIYKTKSRYFQAFKKITGKYSLSASRWTILIVDDEKDTLEYLALVLEKEQMKVIAVDNGFDALQKIRETKIDLVLTDIAMPDMDGYELYSQIRNFDENIPIIMMTGFGYDPNHVLVKARKDGLHDIIFKPFEVEDLIKMVDKALE
jgi:phosphoribosylaminoimidazole-succinocarboxamide synthase